MYESFFGLREKPFSLLPDPSFLFLSKIHQEALTLLEYGLLSQAGFTILSGEIGSGKTTLMRYLLERLDVDITVGLISHTHQSLGQIMDWICLAFDLKVEQGSRLDQHQAFVDFLIEQYAQGKRTLLIVDEAQNLGVDKLEELRLLSNINSDKDFVLQLMLLGQPQLRDQLRQPELEQFVQRVAASYHLGRLSSEETYKYIRHRIKIAGCENEIFTSDACHAVYHYSKGIPRIINLICDTALIYAFGSEQHIIYGELIDEYIASHAPHLLISIETEERVKPKGPKPVFQILPASQDEGEPDAIAPETPSAAAPKAQATMPDLETLDARAIIQKNTTKPPIESNRIAPDFPDRAPKTPRPALIPTGHAEPSPPAPAIKSPLRLIATTVAATIGFSLIVWYGLQGQYSQTDPVNSPVEVIQPAPVAPLVEPPKVSTPPVVVDTPPTPIEPVAVGNEAVEPETPSISATPDDQSAIQPEDAVETSPSAPIETDAAVTQTPELIANPPLASIPDVIQPEPTPEPTPLPEINPMLELEGKIKALSLDVSRSDNNQLKIDFADLVQFNDGSTELNAKSKDALKQFAGLLQEFDALAIKVTGHTDSMGRIEVNRRLSQKRANAVSRFLAQQGISSNRLTAVGMGKSQLKITPEQEQALGLWVNRRIEIDLTAPAAP